MKTNYNPYLETLKEMDECKIYSKEALRLNLELYAKYWNVAENFAAFCLTSKTTTNKDGECLPGNAYRVKALVEAGITTKEEIKLDAAIKLVDKLDKLIYDKYGNHRTVQHQYNCAYNAINHMVADLFKKLPPEEIRVFSLQDTVKSDKVSPDDACTYEDITGDETYNGERVFIEHETVSELTKILKAKKVKEVEEKRKTILDEIACLSQKPAEVLVRIALTHLNMKPRELAAQLVEKGVDYTYANVLYNVAKKNHIKIEDLRNAISGKIITAESVKADTKDAETVAKQISRLAWRADKNLNK